MNVTNPNPTFCASLYNTGATSVDWFSKNTKALTASAGETLGKVWASVSTFFSSIATTLGQWLNAAKDGLFAAKDQIKALPRETMIVGAIGLAATAVVSWVACNFMNKAPTVLVPNAALAAQQPVVQQPVVQQPVA